MAEAPRRQEPDLLEDILYGRQRGLFDDPKGRGYLRAYWAGEQDPEILGMLRGRVHYARMQELFGGVPFLLPRLPRGDLLLGRDVAHRPVRIPHRMLNDGTLAAGNTGSGKTTLNKFLLLQVFLLCKVWTSDQYKRELRHLRPFFRRAGSDLIILSPANLRLNVLQPPRGCDPRAWLPVAVDILIRGLNLPPRASGILRQVCHALYLSFGVYGGRTDRYPTIFDVFLAVRENRELNHQARESIVDALGSLLTDYTPRWAAWRLGWDPLDLARQNIVLELRGTAPSTKALIAAYLLFSVFHARVELERANRPLDLWICFEDAQRFFQKSSAGEMSPTEELAGLIRGTGTGWCFTIQTLGDLSRSVMSNTSIKVMGRLGSHEDYQQLGSQMGLTPEQMQWAKLNLRPGTFVAQLGAGEFREPFVLQVPRLEIPAAVSDAEAAESVRALEELRTVPAAEFANWEAEPVMRVAAEPARTAAPPPEPVAEPAQTTAVPAQPAEGPTLSDAEYSFLRAVAEHPGRPSNEYPGLAGISSRIAANIRRRLIELNYIRFRPLATGRRGRNALILEPLPAGLAALEERQRRLRGGGR